MPRPPSDVLTEREAQIMEILWTQGEATAELICSQLPDKPHDSTIRTLLRILGEKGYVQITGRQPAIYQSCVPREDVQSKAARSLLARFFGGAADALVLRLLEDEELTPEQLELLKKKWHSRHRKGKNHDGSPFAGH
jgi:BlaI family penicillinase repressor